MLRRWMSPPAHRLGMWVAEIKSASFPHAPGANVSRSQTSDKMGFKRRKHRGNSCWIAHFASGGKSKIQAVI